MTEPTEKPKQLKKQILAHYCYCIGQGAGAKWIEGRALTAMMNKFGQAIDNIIEQQPENPSHLYDEWHDDKFFVLQMFREIGRYAATAESAGLAYITTSALEAAWEHVRKTHADIGVEGDWCEWET